MKPPEYGGVSLWRYRENRHNYPGYHLTADTAGCDFLLASLQRLVSASSALHIELPLAPLSPDILAVPNNRRGNATVRAFTRLELVTEPHFEQRHMRFTEQHPKCVIDLSSAQAGCFADGVRDIANGKGDYCIGEVRDQELWFWWHPGA
jgi:hypothetical protein